MHAFSNSATIITINNNILVNLRKIITIFQHLFHLKMKCPPTRSRINYRYKLSLYKILQEQISLAPVSSSEIFRRKQQREHQNNSLTNSYLKKKNMSATNFNLDIGVSWILSITCGANQQCNSGSLRGIERIDPHELVAQAYL